MSPTHLPSRDLSLTTVPTANEYYRILLPQITSGDGYFVTFANTTNTTQIFAKSNNFKIEAGTRELQDVST